MLAGLANQDGLERKMGSPKISIPALRLPRFNDVGDGVCHAELTEIPRTVRNNLIGLDGRRRR